MSRGAPWIRDRKPRQILPQHFPEEEQERGECLVLGGGGDVAAIGERVEKGGYVLGVKGSGIFAAVEFIVPAHSVDIGLFGAMAQMPESQDRPRPITAADGSGILAGRLRSRH